MGFFKRLTKPDVDVSLNIPKATVGLGEDLKGTIEVSSDEEFDATEVRLELRCVEKRRRERWVYDERRRRRIRQVYWDVATLHADDPELSGRIHLVPGFRKTFPFKVNIPAGGRESFDGLDANVSWAIKAVVAVKGRPDATSETTELQVVQAALAQVKDEPEMVSCEYCNSLMTESAVKCPHCGAPRKAIA
jgi:rubrerythrin